jgi:hypothetical protein
MPAAPAAAILGRGGGVINMKSVSAHLEMGTLHTTPPLDTLNASAGAFFLYTLLYAVGFAVLGGAFGFAKVGDWLRR